MHVRMYVNMYVCRCVYVHACKCIYVSIMLALLFYDVKRIYVSSLSYNVTVGSMRIVLRCLRYFKKVAATMPSSSYYYILVMDLLKSSLYDLNVA